MDDEGGRTGLWIGLIAAILVAVVFGVLWFLRGGEITRLTGEMRTAEANAAGVAQRLENDLRSARSDLEAANRRAAQTETRLRDELTRATDSASENERRLRSDLDQSSSQLRIANTELRKIRAELASRDEAGEAGAELETVRGELERAQTQINELTWSRDDAASRHEEELKAVRASLATAEARLEEMARTIESRDEEVRQLRENRETAAAPEALSAVSDAGAASDAEEATETLRAELETAIRGLAEANKKVEEIQADNARLTEELERVRREATAREEELLKTIDELTGAGSAADTADVDAELSEYRERVEALQRDADEMRQSREELEKTAGELRRRLADREDDFNRRLAEMESRRREAARAHAAEKARLEQALDAVEARNVQILADAKDESDRLESASVTSVKSCFDRIGR